MGIVYLIANEEWSQFKIGETKNSNVRKKTLQTGNGSELTIVKTFESIHYKKVERWMHKKYASKRLSGEWFALDDDDIRNFTSDCQKAHDTYEFLIDSGNPFI